MPYAASVTGLADPARLTWCCVLAGVGLVLLTFETSLVYSAAVEDGPAGRGYDVFTPRLKKSRAAGLGARLFGAHCNALEDAANAKLEQKIRDKKKTRGRSKLKAKLKKRLKNVISKETNMLRDKVADEAREKKRKRKAGGDGAAAGDDAPADTSTALDRLFSRAKKR